MKKGAVILPVCIEYIPTKAMVIAKTKSEERSGCWATEQHNRDVVQVGKRAVSTTSRWESS